MDKQIQTEEIITTTLETTSQICKTILNTNLVKLPQEAKNKFTDTIQLIQILMLSNFKEFPDHWTLDSIQKTYHQILPNLLTETERKYTKDILITYLDIVGNATNLSSYKVISQFIQTT